MELEVVEDLILDCTYIPDDQPKAYTIVGQKNGVRTYSPMPSNYEKVALGHHDTIEIFIKSEFHDTVSSLGILHHFSTYYFLKELYNTLQNVDFFVKHKTCSKHSEIYYSEIKTRRYKTSYNNYFVFPKCDLRIFEYITDLGKLKTQYDYKYDRSVMSVQSKKKAISSLISLWYNGNDFGIWFCLKDNIQVNKLFCGLNSNISIAIFDHYVTINLESEGKSNFEPSQILGKSKDYHIKNPGILFDVFRCNLLSQNGNKIIQDGYPTRDYVTAVYEYGSRKPYALENDSNFEQCRTALELYLGTRGYSALLKYLKNTYNISIFNREAMLSTITFSHRNIKDLL